MSLGLPQASIYSLRLPSYEVRSSSLLGTSRKRVLVRVLNQNRLIGSTPLLEILEYFP